MKDDRVTPSPPRRPVRPGSGGDRDMGLANSGLHFKVLGYEVPNSRCVDSGARLWLRAGSLVPLPLGLQLFAAAPARLAIGESVSAH
jgi:hypothetical protein